MNDAFWLYEDVEFVPAAPSGWPPAYMSVEPGSGLGRALDCLYDDPPEVLPGPHVEWCTWEGAAFWGNIVEQARDGDVSDLSAGLRTAPQYVEIVLPDWHRSVTALMWLGVRMGLCAG